MARQQWCGQADHMSEISKNCFNISYEIILRPLNQRGTE